MVRKEGLAMGKITTVSHIRILNDLEAQAVLMALQNRLSTDSTKIVMSLGDENGVPFIAVRRGEISSPEVTIKFEAEHKNPGSAGEWVVEGRSTHVDSGPSVEAVRKAAASRSNNATTSKARKGRPGR
jgi:hypothetical protein